MTPIVNLDKYNVSMQKSLEDKLYFLDYLEGVECFVDFGCADGTLLRAVHERRPELKLVGIDMNHDMVDLCCSKLPEAQIVWSKYPTYSRNNFNHMTNALNLSSVIHEVYAYGRPADIDKFWAAVKMWGYDYIFIRDMTYSPEDYSFSYTCNVDKVRELANPQQLEDFEREWGSITIQKNLKHFLLKYRYLGNWERELKEQYLPLTKEQLIALLADKYECIYLKDYILPYHAQKVHDDFGITLHSNTHLQAIFKRKNTP